MSIYIKGLEMPKDGELLCIDIYPDGKVSINLDLTREQAATAIPVPSHGDLIDRDEMRKTIKPWSPEDERTGCTFDTVKKLMHTMISRAPVVIPAEEGAR